MMQLRPARECSEPFDSRTLGTSIYMRIGRIKIHYLPRRLLPWRCPLLTPRHDKASYRRRLWFGAFFCVGMRLIFP